jgi:phosphate transport system substrate-binding protein
LEGPYTKLTAIGTIVLVIFGYFGFAYTVHWWPYSPPSSPAPKSSPSSTPTAAVTNQSPACATGPLQLVGSSAFMPIAQDAADAYMQACRGATISVSDGDSAYGLTKVRDAVQSRSSSAGSMIAMYDGVPSASYSTGLKSYPMGVLIYSVVAHTGLYPTGDITTDQLRTIFVRPGQPGLVAAGRRAGSGSRQAFIANVLHVNPGPPDPDSCPPPNGNRFSFTSCTEDSTTDELNFVNGTPNAIGYAEIFQHLTGFPKVSTLDIDGAAPTQANVINGSYKYWITEHLFASTQPTTLTKDFLSFLPRYIQSYPPPDFIACSGALKKAKAGC